MITDCNLCLDNRHLLLLDASDSSKTAAAKLGNDYMAMCNININFDNQSNKGSLLSHAMQGSGATPPTTSQMRQKSLNAQKKPPSPHKCFHFSRQRDGGLIV